MMRRKFFLMLKKNFKMKKIPFEMLLKIYIMMKQKMLVLKVKKNIVTKMR
ncbi:hypothetical protein X975_11912, partial [Stegodyphus mimosarum]